jgi:tRNA-splicing ligase RtcB (3'-phosphate/5'-hydroxy nucleic acid ligase)
MTVQQVIHEPGSAPVKVWTNDIEGQAREQLRLLATLPFIHKHVAVMPDVHAGIGSTVGTVIPTRKAIVPAAVGVDIGCGMIAAKLNIRPDQLPDNLAGIRAAIEAAVPHGRTDNGGANDRGAWSDIPALVQNYMEQSREYAYGARFIKEAAPQLERAVDRAHKHIGTLGTGNHFIELCLDTAGGVWLMLHSGSRGVGNAIGRYYIDKAKEDMERYHITLAHPDLAYLPEGTPLFKEYWRALEWAQNYAAMNRNVMLHSVLIALSKELGLGIVNMLDSGQVAVNCHHNYATIENHFGANVYVTRKGAVRARAGDLAVIPGSMGAKSFIVRGKGNADSFCSCSHGAGRRMSRTEAHRRFTVEDLAAQTAGVECRKDAAVVDEIPGAYKPIDEVMDYQSDLVEVVATLRQIVCVKG